MKISFFGAAQEVGRSCFLLEWQNKKILLDAGIKLGAEGSERHPTIPLFIAPQLDCIVVSHAHIDHTGFIPFLVRSGFKGKIFATKPTRDIMHLLLSDAVKIAKENKERFYCTKEIEKTMALVEALEYKEPKEILPGMRLEFYNAGHILGSSLVLLSLGEKKLLYTSDFNNRETSLLNAAELPQKKIDYLLMESTYAGKNDKLPSLKNASKQLADAVKKTLKHGGKVLVPVFAVGRGQEIMFVLENYIRSGYLPALEIFVDGMIGRANKICRHNVVYLREEIPNRILLADDDPFKSPFIKTPKTKNKKDVFAAKKAVILATSGMLSGGPSVFYLQKLAGSKKNTIILVGYQAEGSIGRRLSEGAKEIELRKKKVKVGLEVKEIHFSGHADYNGLLDFAAKANAEKTVLVHGETKKMPDLKKAVEARLKKEVLLPRLNETIEFAD